MSSVYQSTMTCLSFNTFTFWEGLRSVYVVVGDSGIGSFNTFTFWEGLRPGRRLMIPSAQRSFNTFTFWEGLRQGDSSGIQHVR